MLVLGIETSCDETAAAVVDVEPKAAEMPIGWVRADVIHSQDVHARYGGIVPELASRDHLLQLDTVVTAALERASITFADLDGIAVTARPGLLGALLVGVQYAKALAYGLDLPLVGVDHLMGHIFSVFLRREGDDAQVPSFPFVALLVSGGHTALYNVSGPRPEDLRELGATRDDAAGEAFDKVAKMLGLGYPGGPRIDACAARGNPTRYALPRALPGSLELSFSGVKTQVARLIERGEIRVDEDVDDAAASFQRAVVDALCTKLRDAARAEGARALVIGGGVAANRELRARVAALAESAGIPACIPALANTTDNAAMIAYVGGLRLHAGERDPLSLGAISSTLLPRTTRKGRGHRAARG